MALARKRSLVDIAVLAAALTIPSITTATGAPPEEAVTANAAQSGEKVPPLPTPLVGGYLLSGTPNFSRVNMDLVTHFFWAFSTIRGRPERQAGRGKPCAQRHRSCERPRRIRQPGPGANRQGRDRGPGRRTDPDRPVAQVTQQGGLARQISVLPVRPFVRGRTWWSCMPGAWFFLLRLLRRFGSKCMSGTGWRCGVVVRGAYRCC